MMNLIMVNYQKINLKAVISVRKTAGAAGADLTPSESGTIERFEIKKIPTRIRIKIPEGFHGQIHTRSSVLLKNLFITGINNADYRDKIFLIVKNNNPYPIDYSVIRK